jgi:hypothetical protein
MGLYVPNTKTDTIHATLASMDMFNLHTFELAYIVCHVTILLNNQ